MALIGLGEPSKAEPISDHKGIDLVGLVLIGIGSFEIADEFGVELIEGRMKRSQVLTGGQEIDQVKIKEGGGFSGNLEGREPLFLEEMEEVSLQGFCSGEGVWEGGTSHLLSFLIHEADGIAFRAHITTNE
jgi:hypothetical protein